MLRMLLRAAKQGDAWPRTASYVVVYLSCSIYDCFEGSSSGGSFGETESVGSLDGVLRVAAGTQRSPSMKICTGAKKF